jgi:hypothetical protein
MTALIDIITMYEAHAREPHMRLVLAEYEACVVQLERAASQLTVLGEARWALGLESRAHDLVRQAQRHTEAISKCTCKRGMGVVLIAGCMVHDKCQCAAIEHDEPRRRCPWCERNRPIPCVHPKGCTFCNWCGFRTNKQEI